MANTHPHGYPLPASALHLTTSDGARFAILLEPNHYPVVLAPIQVYNVESIYVRDGVQHETYAGHINHRHQETNPQQETFIEPNDHRLGGDLRTNVTLRCAIELTWVSLDIVWPQNVTVTICGVPNVRAVTFVFEHVPQRYGSNMLSSARSGPPRVP